MISYIRVGITGTPVVAWRRVITKKKKKEKRPDPVIYIHAYHMTVSHFPVGN